MIDIEKWIKDNFAGRGRAIRRAGEEPYPGEPYMSMEEAKDLVRMAFSLAPAGTVKPLVWRKLETTWWSADTPVGEYLINRVFWKIGDNDFTLYLKINGVSERLDGGFSTLDPAKAAAQANYEARIWSALLPPQPSADLPPLEFVGTISTLTPDGVSAIVALDPEVGGVKCAVLNTQTVGRLKLITSGLYKKGQPVSGTAVRGPDALLAVTIEAALVSQPQPEGVAVAWECWYSGAGSVDSTTLLTRRKHDADAAKAAGAIVKPLTYLHPTPRKAGADVAGTMEAGVIEELDTVASKITAMGGYIAEAEAAITRIRSALPDGGKQ